MPLRFFVLFWFFFVSVYISQVHTSTSHIVRVHLSLFFFFFVQSPQHSSFPSPPCCCLCQLFDVTLLICENTSESRSAFMHTFCCPVERLLKRPNPSKFRPSRVHGGGGGSDSLSVRRIWNATAPPSLKLPHKTEQGSSGLR